jgi:hypothetical protein
MNRRWTHFAVGALSSLAVALVLNLLPYWRSYQAYQYDGFETIGFPFVFRHQGGFAYRYEFHPELLLANVAIALAFATVAGWAVMQILRIAHKPGRGFPVLPRSDGGAAAE